MAQRWNVILLCLLPSLPNFFEIICCQQRGKRKRLQLEMSAEFMIT